MAVIRCQDLHVLGAAEQLAVHPVHQTTETRSAAEVHSARAADSRGLSAIPLLLATCADIRFLDLLRPSVRRHDPAVFAGCFLQAEASGHRRSRTSPRILSARTAKTAHLATTTRHERSTLSPHQVRTWIVSCMTLTLASTTELSVLN